jgi:hypothetical protein
MKLSIVTPVVSLHPGAHGPWGGRVDRGRCLVAETADPPRLSEMRLCRQSRPVLPVDVPERPLTRLRARRD